MKLINIEVTAKDLAIICKYLKAYKTYCKVQVRQAKSQGYTRAEKWEQEEEHRADLLEELELYMPDEQH